MNNINCSVNQCLYEISKTMFGNLYFEIETKEQCDRLDCVIINTSHIMKAEVKSFQCDSSKIPNIDGIIKSRVLHRFIESGNNRGKHHGIFEWYTSPDFIILGEMNGITNAGTHHKPLRDCEECNLNSHLEGKLNGYLKFKDSGDTMQGYEISAIYAIDIKWETNVEPFRQENNGRLEGTIEGIVSRFCNEL
jgi:hypothetical protein